ILQEKSVPYISQAMPAFLSVIRNDEFAVKEFCLKQLCLIISILKKYIRAHLDDIFELIHDLWSTNKAMKMTLLSVVDQIVLEFGGEFRNYLPGLVAHILDMLRNGSDHCIKLKMLSKLTTFIL